MKQDRRRRHSEEGRGDGEGQEPKDEASSWDSKRMLEPVTVVLGYPGNPGVLPASHLL